MTERLASMTSSPPGQGRWRVRFWRFWQPIYCAHEILPGRAVPIRIMGENFTLYRGESGTPHLVGDRCVHRGTQLSVGWIEEDSIRRAPQGQA